MAVVTVPKGPDATLAPVWLARYQGERAQRDALAARLIDAEARLGKAEQEHRDVMGAMIVRAGGTLSPSERVSDVVVNADGSATLTTAPV